jgi:hypothetical protein
VCHVFLAMKTISIRTPSALARGIPLASSTYGGPPLVDRVRPVAANTEDQFRQQTRAPPPKGSCRCPSRRTTNDIPPSVSATPAAWPPPSPAPSTPHQPGVLLRAQLVGSVRRMRSMAPFPRSAASLSVRPRSTAGEQFWGGFGLGLGTQVGSWAFQFSHTDGKKRKGLISSWAQGLSNIVQPEPAHTAQSYHQL